MKQIPEEILARMVFKTNSEEHANAVPQLIKLLPVEQQCPDCPQIVKDRVVDIKQRQTPYKHWRAYCLSCKLCKNPDTGKFDISQYDLDAVYRHKLKKSDK